MATIRIDSQAREVVDHSPINKNVSDKSDHVGYLPGMRQVMAIGQRAVRGIVKVIEILKRIIFSKIGKESGNRREVPYNEFGQTRKTAEIQQSINTLYTL